MTSENTLFVVQSPDMPEGQFDLYSTNREMWDKCNLPREMTLKFVSLTADLADRFTATGIARREIQKGRNAILVVAPGAEVCV